MLPLQLCVHTISSSHNPSLHIYISIRDDFYRHGSEPNQHLCKSKQLTNGGVMLIVDVVDINILKVVGKSTKDTLILNGIFIKHTPTLEVSS